MEPQAVCTEKAPGAVGPYSQAVRCGGLLFCSGQIPLVPATGELVTGGIEAQAEQVMRNLQSVLEAAGTSWRRVVKTTIYLAAMDDFAAVNEIYGRFLGDPHPARATVAVAGLPKGVRLEIDAIASLEQAS